MTVNIRGLDVADVLVALWEHSQEQGFSFLGTYSKNFTREQAQEELERNHGYCDYVNGRVIKCDLFPGATEFDSRLYDRDNGDGAAERAVDSIR